MKRSGMVLIIAESLVEPRFDDVMKEASSILKRIEKHGMLPPAIKNPEYRGPLQQYDWIKPIINLWEPEDSEAEGTQ